jgi:glycerol-3-phosphate dehydrogenase
VNFSRADALRRLTSEDFDVLVVGGGITGVGVALDATTRGLRTALIDKGDLASGTSSKSSKLVHGGIRYLQQKEVRLVYEALAERQVLRKTAPHLVHVLRASGSCTSASRPTRRSRTCRRCHANDSPARTSTTTRRPTTRG